MCAVRIKLSGTQAMELLLREYGLAYVKEKEFHPIREWGFDFAIPEYKIAIEVEGGTFGHIVVCNHCGMKVSGVSKKGHHYYVRAGGRHNRGKGYEEDREKYNTAQVLGWRVLSFTPEMILSQPVACMDQILLLIKGVG